MEQYFWPNLLEHLYSQISKDQKRWQMSIQNHKSAKTEESLQMSGETQRGHLISNGLNIKAILKPL